MFFILWLPFRNNHFKTNKNMKFLKKEIQFSAILLLSMVSNAQDWNAIPVPANAGTGKVWQLQTAQSDDFNYNFSATSTAATIGGKWTNFYHNAWDGPGPTKWKRENVSVSEGFLKLKATRVAGELKTYPVYNTTDTKPATRSGCVTSNAKVIYPVFVEARIKVMNSVMASNIWMLSPDDTQELDILECYGGKGNDNRNSFFSERIHLSHHVFERSNQSNILDYQPADWNSWWRRSDVSQWGGKWVRIGMYWKSPTVFEYYVDGQHVRTIDNTAFATKNIDNIWEYTYPSGFTNGVLDKFTSGQQSGYQKVNTATSLANAKALSTTSVIDPYNFLNNGKKITKELEIIINIEDQNWQAVAGRTPNAAEIANTADHTMLVDWVRVYKPVTANNNGNNESVNVALNKTATQSSDYNSSLTASKAIDGNENNFSHTNEDANAWLEVDLGANYDIETVKIFNRKDCCQDRLQKYQLFVSSNPFTSKNIVTTANQANVGVYYQNDSASSPTTVNVGRKGRYVRIQLIGTNFLHISELEVWGKNAVNAKNTEGLMDVNQVNSKELIGLYPNPAKDFMIISGVQNIESVSVVDLSGRKITIEKQKIENGISLNISNLQSGTYIAVIENDKQPVSLKFIKE